MYQGIPGFLGISDSAADRINRTGDLRRMNTDGEIVHHGRLDTRVKIRGHRMELTGIQPVLQGHGIAPARPPS